MSWNTTATGRPEPDVFGDLAKASTAHVATTTAPPARTAPTDRGERLGTFERGDSEELRVCWDEFKGHPYLSLRVWTRKPKGEWWPDKQRGCSVRVRELEGFAEVIERALENAAVTSPAGGSNGDG